MPTPQELLELLEQRFILGEVSEAMYKELKAKLLAKIEASAPAVDNREGVMKAEGDIVGGQKIVSHDQHVHYHGPPGPMDVLATCPLCGRRNKLENTFRCLKCLQDNLCLSHFVERFRGCEKCAAEQPSPLTAQSPPAQKLVSKPGAPVPPPLPTRLAPAPPVSPPPGGDGGDRAARRAAALRELFARNMVASRSLILYLHDVLAISAEQAEAIIDGFWDYILRKGNYHGGGHRGPYLVVPHFGTFWRKGGHLIFHSRRRRELEQVYHLQPLLGAGLYGRTFPANSPVLQQLAQRLGQHSRMWTTRVRDLADRSRLSVKRRMAAAVSASTRLPLDLVSDALGELLDVLAMTFIEGRRHVSWFRRGRMKLVPSWDRYTFRVYATFRQQLQRS